MTPPPIICLVGCDGSGKSTLAKHAITFLRARGHRPVLVWSRYNHFFSKPLLALAKLTGHSWQEVADGVAFGYHDFRAPWLRWTFPRLQALDVRLATARKLRAAAREGDVLVFERSPWDTLADVILDTGDAGLIHSRWGRRIVAPVRGRGPVVWISRPKDAILATRPELRHDRSLEQKMAIYGELAAAYGWTRLDNTGSLKDATMKLEQQLSSET